MRGLKWLQCRHNFNSDSQQYPSKLCLIKYCIKYRCFPFWKLSIFICGFSTKVTHAFLASETKEKWRFQRYIGHATLKKGGSLEIRHVFHWSIITLYNIKKTLKYLFCPKLKSFIKKALINTALSVKMYFNIIQYVSLSILWKYRNENLRSRTIHIRHLSDVHV